MSLRGKKIVFNKKKNVFLIFTIIFVIFLILNEKNHTKIQLSSVRIYLECTLTMS